MPENVTKYQNKYIPFCRQDLNQMWHNSTSLSGFPWVKFSKFPGYFQRYIYFYSVNSWQNFSKNWNYVAHSRLNQAFHSTDNLNIGKIWISRETLHRDYKIEGAGKSYNSLPDRIDGQQSVQLHQKRIVQALIFLQDYKIYILKEIFCNTIKLAHK